MWWPLNGCGRFSWEWHLVSLQLPPSLGVFLEEDSYIIPQSCQKYSPTNLRWHRDYLCIPEQPCRLSHVSGPFSKFQFFHMTHWKCWDPLHPVWEPWGLGTVHNHLFKSCSLRYSEQIFPSKTLRSEVDISINLYDHMCPQIFRRLMSGSLRSLPTYYGQGSTEWAINHPYKSIWLGLVASLRIRQFPQTLWLIF